MAMAHHWLRLAIFALLAVVLCAPPAAAQRKADERLGPPPLPSYRKQWAIIIGINYDSLSGEHSAEAPPLSTAEADAQALALRLQENYGYGKDEVRVLLGDEATRTNIRQLFGDSFLGDDEQVTSDDSVLIYFAGHGNRRERSSAEEDYVGLLYPADLHVVAGRGVDAVSCLRIDELLGMLDDYCAARHKLVILDSCHSGEVFNFQARRSSGVNRDFRAQLFVQPSFQAIAAAGAGQFAADAAEIGEHSAFTQALLDALQYGPDADRPKVFTASELFAYLPRRVGEISSSGQDPRGGWLGGEGDFYFFPKDLDEADAAELIAAMDRYRADHPEEAATMTATPEKPGGSNLLWILGGGAVVLLVGAGTASVVALKLRSSQTQSSTAMQAQAEAAMQGSSQHVMASPAPPSGIIEVPTYARASAARKVVLKIAGLPCEVQCVFGVAAVMGRSTGCEFPFTQAPRSVSNKHARLKYLPAEESFAIEDLASSNGTFVNEERVDGEHALATGQLAKLSAAFPLKFRAIENREVPTAELVYEDANGIELARCYLVPGHILHLSDALASVPGAGRAGEALGVIVLVGQNKMAWKPTLETASADDMKTLSEDMQLHLEEDITCTVSMAG